MINLCASEYSATTKTTEISVALDIIDHLAMSLCRVVSCVVGRGYLLRPVHSLGKTLLAFPLLHCVLQGQIRLLLQGFPVGSEVKVSASNVGDLGSIPGLGRFPGEGNGNPLQYSCLKNPMDGGAW